MLLSETPIYTHGLREHSLPQADTDSRLEYTDPFQSQQYNLNKGLIFLKERDILLTTDTWTIVISISTDDYDNVIARVNTLLEYLDSQQNNTPVNNLIPYYEISRLKSNLKITQRQISNLKLLLPTSREKRGLINGLGTVFKFLFGTLDDDDYQSLNSRLDSLEDKGDSVIHIESDRLSYMKRLTSEVESHSKAIQLLVNTLKTTTQELININFTIWTEIEQLKRLIQYQSKISSLLREIEITLNVVNTQLIQLQEALDITSNGYLSSLLITPAKLNNILKEVVRELPVGLSLVVDTDIDKVYNYYRIARVHAISTKNVIRLIVEIPLQSTKSQFELFAVKPLPYYDKILTQFITVRSESNYFAISKDRLNYVLLNNEQVQQCVKTPYGIYPLSVPVIPASESSSCAFAMFTGDNEQSHRLCKREVMINYNKPTLYAGTNGDFWIYSMPKPIQVTIQCFIPRNNLKDISPRTQVLTGTGILQNTRNCYVYSKHFTLLPHSKGTSFASIQTNHVVIPPIRNTLTFSEIKIFQPSNGTTSTDVTEDIQEILNNVTDPVDIISITELQRKLQLIRDQRTQATTSYSFITIFLLIFFLTTSVIAFVCGIRHSITMRKLFIPAPTVITSHQAQPTEVIYEEIQGNSEVRFVRGPVTSTA